MMEIVAFVSGVPFTYKFASTGMAESQRAMPNVRATVEAPAKLIATLRRGEYVLFPEIVCAIIRMTGKNSIE